MNIGDKVRFLNDVGGGKITGFRQGGIVMVEDEDGFAVPMSQHEVVVIEEKPSSPSFPVRTERIIPSTGRSSSSPKPLPLPRRMKWMSNSRLVWFVWR